MARDRDPQPSLPGLQSLPNRPSAPWSPRTPAVTPDFEYTSKVRIAIGLVIGGLAMVSVCQADRDLARTEEPGIVVTFAKTSPVQEQYPNDAQALDAVKDVTP